MARDTDVEAWAFLNTFNSHRLALHTAKVKIPGVVAAMNLKLEMAQGDILAFTDDDAAPGPDWLARMEAQLVV